MAATSRDGKMNESAWTDNESTIVEIIIDVTQYMLSRTPRFRTTQRSVAVHATSFSPPRSGLTHPTPKQYVNNIQHFNR